MTAATTAADRLRRVEAARRLRLIADLLHEPGDSPIRGAAALLAGDPPNPAAAAVTPSVDTAAELAAIVDVFLDPDTVPTYCVRCASYAGVDIPDVSGHYRCDRCRRFFTIGGRFDAHP